MHVKQLSLCLTQYIALPIYDSIYGSTNSMRVKQLSSNRNIKSLCMLTTLSLYPCIYGSPYASLHIRLSQLYACKTTLLKSENQTWCVIIASCPATHVHVLTFGGVDKGLGFRV